MSKIITSLILFIIAQTYIISGKATENFIKRHLEQSYSAICEKPNKNYFTFRDQMGKCRTWNGDHLTYDKDCLQKLLPTIEQAACNNLKVGGTLLVTEVALNVGAAATNDLGFRNTSAAIKSGFNSLALFPFIALVAETFGLFTLCTDIQNEIRKK